MKNPFAGRLSRITPSATLAITTRANQIRAEGGNVLNLAAGEPDFDTPLHIQEAAIAAMQAGKTKYTPVAGTVTLRQAITTKFKRDNQLDYETDEVMVSNGGKQVFYNLCQALLNPGDEVLIPSPYWVSYPDIVLLAEGRPVIISGSDENHYKITASDLEKTITNKTKLFVINSPSNPSGMAYSKNELAELGGVLEKHKHIYVITDDMYEHILFRGHSFTNVLNAAPELKDRTIILNGVSKAYSMTGWRIGYAAGPSTLIKAMISVQEQSTSNPSSISQAAAEAALLGDQTCVATMCEAFEQRHNFIVEALNDLNGIHCAPSDGTFYCFPNVNGMIEKIANISDDIELSEYLLNTSGMAVVPGSAFGSPGHIRISYAAGMDVLEDTVARLRKL